MNALLACMSPGGVRRPAPTIVAAPPSGVAEAGDGVLGRRASWVTRRPAPIRQHRGTSTGPRGAVRPGADACGPDRESRQSSHELLIVVRPVQHRCPRPTRRKSGVEGPCRSDRAMAPPRCAGVTGSSRSHLTVPKAITGPRPGEWMAPCRPTLPRPARVALPDVAGAATLRIYRTLVTSPRGPLESEVARRQHRHVRTSQAPMDRPRGGSGPAPAAQSLPRAARRPGRGVCRRRGRPRCGHGRGDCARLGRLRLWPADPIDRALNALRARGPTTATVGWRAAEGCELVRREVPREECVPGHMGDQPRSRL